MSALPLPLELDVRDMFRDGRSPLAAIMQAVAELQPGQSLRLRVPLRPVPLIALMEDRGFAAQVRAHGEADFEVVFTPSA